MSESVEQADWNDIRHFIVLVEKQTLTAAAEALNVQHSTVSRRVAQLEGALKLRLFDRIGKRYLLTDDGQRIYAQAQEIAQNINMLQRSAREQRSAMTEVVLTAPPAVIQSLILPHLGDFHARQPRIRLVLDSSIGFSNLHQRQADIALRLSRPEQNDLAVRALRTVHFGFYAHADYPAITARTDWQFLNFTATTRFNRWAADQMANERILASSNDFCMHKQALLRGLGVGMLPDYAVFPSDNLTPVAIHSGMPETLQGTLYLIMHEDVRRSPNVRAAADFWVQVLAESPPPSETCCLKTP